MRPKTIRRALIATVATAVLVIAGASASPAIAAPSAPAASVPLSVAQTPAQEVAALINQERAKAGLPALVVRSTIDGAATDWAAYLARTGTFVHSSAAWRNARLSVGWTASGENLAAGYTTAKAAMAGWMASAGHKANILNRSYRSIGVGYVRGGPYGHYWVTIFGIDKPPMPPVPAPRFTTKSSTTVGGTMTLTSTGWPSATTLKFQWYSNGKAISGATGRSLVLKSWMVGTTITVRAYGTHAVYFPLYIMSGNSRSIAASG